MTSAGPTPRYAVPPVQSSTVEGFDRIGDYELLELIGRGGMGRVFKARQVSLGRIVALKILPPDLARNQTFALRFLREARASGKLLHPNVVQGIDCAQDENSGLWYFAMEFIDGYSVADELKRCRALPEDRVVEIGSAIAGALEAAAKHGIVHRDIKPENILISQAGEIKLADLGVAKISAEEDASLTRSEDMVGTPYYVSPEQARGKRDQIDTRSDIYSLGATLFHLATGQPPFQGETCADIMVKHIQEKVPLAHQLDNTISEALSRVIAKMMQKSPSMRYQTPGEVRAALDRARLGVFVGRGETTRTASVITKRTTGAQPALRESSDRIQVGTRSSSRRKVRTISRTSSHRYVLYGVGAILISLAGLVGFLCLDNATEPDLRPPSSSSAPTLPESVSQPAAGAATRNGIDQPPSPTSPSATTTPRKIPADRVVEATPSGSRTVPGLPGWCGNDVGDVAAAGEVQVAGRTITLKASGADIWGTVDEGFFVYRCLRGDASLTLRINSIEATDPWSKVGVMFRETLADDARNAFVFKAANNISVYTVRRKNRETTIGMHGVQIAEPSWVRLTRAGNIFTAFTSADGKTWTKTGSVELPMGRDVYACIATTSHRDGLVATSVVEQFEYEGTPTPAAEWPATPKQPVP